MQNPAPGRAVEATCDSLLALALCSWNTTLGPQLCLGPLWVLSSSDGEKKGGAAGRQQ